MISSLLLLDQVQMLIIVGLACNHTMYRMTFCKQKCNLVGFLIMYFQRFLDRNGGVFIDDNNLMNLIDIFPLLQMFSFLPIGAKL